jgi:hypothetical protein
MTELIHARAYRDGRLVCDRALVTVTACDERLGLAPRERRRRMTVRFVHGIDPAFRAQLMQVLRRRGARSRRMAAMIDAIELELDGQGALTARIEPPAVRHCMLEQTDFSLGDQSERGRLAPPT